MPLEKENFREHLARLSEQYPNREALDLKTVMSILGCDRDTILNEKTFPARKCSGKWLVPIVGLARWLS